jgi:hypothetical protein
MPKQLLKSNSDNNYFPQRDSHSAIRLYRLKKVWIRFSLLSWPNKLIWILIPSLHISCSRKWNNNLFIFWGDIQIPSGGRMLQCPRCLSPRTDNHKIFVSGWKCMVSTHTELTIHGGIGHWEPLGQNKRWFAGEVRQTSWLHVLATAEGRNVGWDDTINGMNWTAVKTNNINQGYRKPSLGSMIEEYNRWNTRTKRYSRARPTMICVLVLKGVRQMRNGEGTAWTTVDYFRLN